MSRLLLRPHLTACGTRDPAWLPKEGPEKGVDSGSARVAVAISHHWMLGCLSLRLGTLSWLAP